MFNLATYLLLRKEYEDALTKKKGNPVDALDNLRVYLDCNNCAMPRPLFRYKEDDITTHKYLDGYFYTNKQGRKVYKENLNPLYKYQSVIPRKYIPVLLK